MSLCTGRKLCKCKSLLVLGCIPKTVNMQILHMSMEGNDRKEMCVFARTAQCRGNSSHQRILPGQQTQQRGDGAGHKLCVWSWRNNGKGEHKNKKELTEGKEGEIKNLREDVQSIAQA